MHGAISDRGSKSKMTDRQTEGNLQPLDLSATPQVKMRTHITGIRIYETTFCIPRTDPRSIVVCSSKFLLQQLNSKSVRNLVEQGRTKETVRAVKIGPHSEADISTLSLIPKRRTEEINGGRIP